LTLVNCSTTCKIDLKLKILRFISFSPQSIIGLTKKAGSMVPFHPIIVHFPIALTFILPLLMLVFIFMIKKNKMSHYAWLIIIGLQIATSISGYVAMNAGENEEDQVEKVVSKKIIGEHEEAAEVFVGSTVILLVLSIAAFFLKKELQFPVTLGICVLSLVSCFLAYKAGESGGELVYKYGAARAYATTSTEGLLPTPGMNTSESSAPSDDNESLKADDNDYGSADEIEDVEDDEGKQED
jgi:uncharacterized membrane protein